MSLIVVGLSHKTAPIELRERMTVPESRLAAALKELRATGEIKEVVILSTCNRLEIYARPSESPEKATAALVDFFQSLYRAVSLGGALYQFDSIQAVQHLFRVASGLDSLVVGETDVLGQVKSAYLFAQENGATGKITNVLFQRALFVGKAVRTKTNISEGSSSVGSIAVQLAERIFGSLKDSKVVLVGAGKIAKITARHLLSQKTGDLVILNRTLARAEEMARLLKGTPGPLEDLESHLLSSDIVICSASSDRPLVTKPMMETIVRARRRSLYFIDIAVPRNVDPAVHSLDNVYVYNIDDLKDLVEENMSQRKRDLGMANDLVSRMAKEFHEWSVGAREGRQVPLRHSFEAAELSARKTP